MSSADFPVAVVGIGCRLPGADGPEAFWQLLMDGADVVTEVPAARTNHPPVYGSPPGSAACGGFLGDVAGFDAAFFRISPREAERMDPQQRLLLEVAWEALEDAHIPPPALAGTRTGVFVGQMGRDYWELQARQTAIDIQALTGSGLFAFASGRLSFVLDLRGPSISLDTACSSSLTAVHLACQSLRCGDSETALAAGVNLILIPELATVYARVGMMASGGRCRFGDARADGFVRSEAVGVAVLKPLDRAVADRDRIYAVILGSAGNNDGRSSGSLVTPAQETQEDVLRQAQARAGVDPADVDYVEAHGTGTRVGDAVELRALSAVLGGGPRERPCLVGSVKTNLGHAEGAAGISGFIKTVLSVYHRRIPASLLLDEPNPVLTEPGTPLRVPSGPVPWPEGAAIAGVTSFGLSGTNVHVVLGAAPELTAGRQRPDAPLILPLSARDPGALRALAATYAGRLDGIDAAAATRLCAAAALGRAHHGLRAAVIGRDGDGLAAALRAVPFDEAQRPAARRSRKPPRVVFVFPGRGQLPGGRDLLAAPPALRAALDVCDKAVRNEAGWSLLDAADAPDGHTVPPGTVGLVTLWALQVALAQHWRSSGVRPDVVIGDGPGEIAAAQIAGQIGPAAAARLACAGGGAGTAPAEPARRDRPVLRCAVTSEVISVVPCDAADRISSLRGPAGLDAAIAAEAGPAPAVFLEIGSGPVLTEEIRLVLADGGASNARALPERQPGSRHASGDLLGLAATTASLYQAGVDLSWEAYYPDKAADQSLPAYPWQRQRTWFEPTTT